jgi:RNA-directed DNA polymerase
LWKQKLPVIYDQEHLSRLLGYRLDYLNDVVSSSPLHYHEHKIAKKTGGIRILHEPHPDLKEIQRWLSLEILSKLKVSKYSKAYRKGISLEDSVKFHVSRNMVLRLDIKDFFPSIRFGKVYEILINLGYSKSVAVMIAKLLLRNDLLPQGSPASPTLSNIIFINLDTTIGAFCREREIYYSRYADDLTFSGESFNYRELIDFVKIELSKNEFKLNKKKTRLMRKHRKQIINGLVVNQKINVEKKYRKEIRQEIYYIKKYGLASHMEKINIHKSSYPEHLLGKLNCNRTA